MTDTVVLNAERREVGTKVASKIRAAGKLPVVIYGHKQQAEPVAVDYKAFFDGIHHGHRIFTFKIDGKSETLMVKELQFDYLGKNIIHADFMRVNLDERMQVKVPVIFKGEAAGFAEGGMLDTVLDHIEIEAVVTQIPESITVSIKELNVGDSLHAKDIEIPDGAKLLTDPEALMAMCHIKASEKAEEEIEPGEEQDESLEPEVITEKKDKEEE